MNAYKSLAQRKISLDSGVTDTKGWWIAGDVFFSVGSWIPGPAVDTSKILKHNLSLLPMSLYYFTLTYEIKYVLCKMIVLYTNASCQQYEV